MSLVLEYLPNGMILHRALPTQEQEQGLLCDTLRDPEKTRRRKGVFNDGALILSNTWYIRNEPNPKDSQDKTKALGIFQRLYATHVLLMVRPTLHRLNTQYHMLRISSPFRATVSVSISKSEQHRPVLVLRKHMMSGR